MSARTHPVMTLVDAISRAAADEGLHEMTPAVRRKVYRILDQYSARDEFKRWLGDELGSRPKLSPLVKLVALTAEGAGNYGIGCTPESLLRRMRGLAATFGVRQELNAWLREHWM